jgi:CBS domain-containing protein
MKVNDLMTREVTTVRADDCASAAAKIMWDCDCGAVPVLGHSGEVIAMITDRDICMATLFHDCPPSGLAVSQAMSSTVHSCAPNDTLAEAEQTLRSNQIRRLPVLDGEGKLLGILSLADIVRAATHRSQGRKKELIPDEVTATLADICTPRRRPNSSARGLSP